MYLTIRAHRIALRILGQCQKMLSQTEYQKQRHESINKINGTAPYEKQRKLSPIEGVAHCVMIKRDVV